MPKIPKEAETRVSAKFQARLKEFMSDAESNNAGYAKAVGVSRDVITRATIYGIVPALRSLIKIADHENVSLAYLLAESDEHSFYKSETPKTFASLYTVSALHFASFVLPLQISLSVAWGTPASTANRYLVIPLRCNNSAMIIRTPPLYLLYR